MNAQVEAKDQPVPTLVSSILQVFRSAFPQDSRLAQANETLTAEIIQSIISQLEELLAQEDVNTTASTRVGSLASILNVFWKPLFDDNQLVAVRQHTHTLGTRRS